MGIETLTRRAFLATTTLAAASACSGGNGSQRSPLAPNTAKVVPKKISPNEKINVACIGVEGMGRVDVPQCAKYENVIALCDVDHEYAKEMFERFPGARRFRDYREMVDELDNLDACTVTIPDHSHAPAAYACMMRGLHVYVQKPLAHTVSEIRFLKHVARKTGVKTQMGNEGHSNEGARRVCEMVWDGAIGQVKEAHVWTDRPRWAQGMAEPLPPQEVPEGLDWNLWIGPSEMRPYNRGYAPLDWRGWWEYGTGALGDMGCHCMDPVFWSLRLMDAPTYSVEVVQQEGLTDESPPKNSILKYSVPARGGMAPVDVYWYDGGHLPERPSDIPEDVKLGDGERGGSFLVGENGYITSGEAGGFAKLLPESRRAEYKMPPRTLPRREEFGHHLDWFTAIRKGDEASANFEYAAPLSEFIILGNVALRAGSRIDWDSKAFRVTNNDKANALLTTTFREGWELPINLDELRET